MPDYRLGKLKGRWVCVWYDEAGKRHRHRLEAGSPVEARAELREFIRRADEIARPKDKLTVGEIWADYVAEKKAQGKVSVGRMEDAWKQIGPWASTFAPGDVTPEAVRGYGKHRRDRGASDGTIHTELGYLRAALRYASKSGRIVSAPSFDLPSKPRPRSRHLTPDEARRLIDACVMPHVLLFIRLALHTAGRPSSILDLTWDRVDFSNKRITLDNPARDRTAKGRATVPMANVLVGCLEDAKAAALTDHVIEWAGKPVKSVKKAVGRVAARAGIEGVTPYVLRHTAAVWMAEGGVPLVEIAQYLGHNNVATTYRVYARFSPDYLQGASGVISKQLHGE